MIIIGYQGIGKSTFSKDSKEYIDLESGCFWVDGKRSEDWYKPYCQIAEHLSAQGYIVFVSSHKEVRETLKISKEKVCAIIPSIELKDLWIEKLKNRYEETKLEKDYKAWKNAEDRYEENINEIINDCKYIRCIRSIDYNLDYEIGSIFIMMKVVDKDILNVELQLPNYLTALTGRDYGRSCYNAQLRSIIEKEKFKNINLIFPKNIKSISISWTQGFFEELKKKLGTIGISETFNIITNNDKLTNIVYENISF